MKTYLCLALLIISTTIEPSESQEALDISARIVALKKKILDLRKINGLISPALDGSYQCLRDAFQEYQQGCTQHGVTVYVIQQESFDWRKDGWDCAIPDSPLKSGHQKNVDLCERFHVLESLARRKIWVDAYRDQYKALGALSLLMRNDLPDLNSQYRLLLERQRRGNHHGLSFQTSDPSLAGLA